MYWVYAFLQKRKVSSKRIVKDRHNQKTGGLLEQLLGARSKTLLKGAESESSILKCFV